MQVRSSSTGRVRFRGATLCAVLTACGVIGVLPNTAVAQPTTVSYQGELQKDGEPFDGNADFKFVIVAGGDSLWSNDGSSSGGSEPTNSVSVTVADGIFSVHLGESPMVPLEANLLNESTDPALRVWVNTGDGFEQLTDQPISSSVFSLHSESADGAPADFHALGALKSGNSIDILGTVWQILTDNPNGELYIGDAINFPDIKLGVGTLAPTATLDVNGQVRIRGGAPGVGKVLTSDANGLGTWETAVGGSDDDWTRVGSPGILYPSDDPLDVVGIGTTSPDARLHVDRVFGDLDVNFSTLRVTFEDLSNPDANCTPCLTTKGVDVESVLLDRKGNQLGVDAHTSVNVSGIAGSARGSLAVVQGFDLQGSVVGASAEGNANSLDNFDGSSVSFGVGGRFRGRPEPSTTMTLNTTGTYYVAGVYGEVGGAGRPIDAPSDYTGAVAGVIGVDSNTGSARSYAGYFDGKGYFSDNLGLGDPTPGFRLTVRGSGNEVYSVMSETGDDSVNHLKIQIAPGSGTPTTRIGYLSGAFGNGFRLTNGVAGPLIFGVGGPTVENMRIHTDGNVGIGIMTPGEKLDVDGNIQATGTIKSGASITVDGINNEIRCSGSLEFQVNGNHGLRLQTATTTPHVIGGSDNNSVTASDGGFIGGGGNPTFANTVSGIYGVIVGGELNTAGPGVFAAVGGGRANRATAAYATVPGGNDNIASGDYSFAAGRNARCNNSGAFVWADAVNALRVSNGANSFVVRASGGTWFYSDAASSTGVTLPAGGGAWSPVSDRNVKENFDLVDGCDVLDRLARIPLQTWNYKTQDASVRHIGPMAQDFQDAFGVGEDDKHISTVDADGVALAAIQGLYELVKEQQQVIDATKAELESLRDKIKRLESASVEIGPTAPQP